MVMTIQEAIINTKIMCQKIRFHVYRKILRYKMLGRYPYEERLTFTIYYTMPTTDTDAKYTDKYCVTIYINYISS